MKKLKYASLALLLGFASFMLVACGAKKVTAITIISGLDNVVLVGTEIDTSNVVASVRYNDDTTENIESDELTFGTIDTTTLGEKSLKITYNDFSINYSIFVSTDAENVALISGYEMPEFINDYNATREFNNTETTDKTVLEGHFVSLNENYLVGDDNAFKFALNLTCINEEGEPIAINSYKSDSKLYLGSGSTKTELTGTELDSYCTLSDTNSEFDFTENAIGNVFTLATKPKYLVEDADNNYVEFTVKVVDGYNIYNENELSIIDNTQTFWNSFKQEKGIPTTLAINGAILHKNFTLKDVNLPECCFYGANRTGGIIESDEFAPSANSELIQHYSLYRHTNTNNQSFAIYGNHFTVDFSNISKIPQNKYGDDFSNLHLFKFIGANAGANVDSQVAGVKNNSYAKIQDCLFVGNAKSTNEQGQALSSDELKESLGGLIFAKVNCENFDLTNCIIRSCFISLFPEYTTFYTATDCKIYESLQNGIFIWRNGDLTLKNTTIERCGGPIAICQHDESAKDTKNVYSPYINADKDCNLQANLSGSEPWFAAVNMSTVVGQFVTLSNGLRDLSVGLDSALHTTVVGQQYTYAQAINGKMQQLGSTLSLNANKTVQLTNEDSKLNIIGVLMSGGFALSPSSVTGKIAIGDNMPLDKNDANAPIFDSALAAAITLDAGKFCIYTDTKDFYVVTKTLNSDNKSYSYANTTTTITNYIQTQIGTILMSNDKTMCETALTDLNNLISMFDDEVMNIYYSGVGLVLGVNEYTAPVIE